MWVGQVGFAEGPAGLAVALAKVEGPKLARAWSGRNARV